MAAAAAAGSSCCRRKQDAVIRQLFREAIAADHEAIAVDDLESHVVGRDTVGGTDGA
jgi:bacterioferritin (cytochrome b1)